MIRNNSFYKGKDLLDESYLSRMKNYFNPYEYNLESNLKDHDNNGAKVFYSKSHEIRKINKNK